VGVAGGSMTSEEKMIREICAVNPKARASFLRRFPKEALRNYWQWIRNHDFVRKRILFGGK